MNHANDILVLGWDAVSCLGTDLNDQWDRAAAGESGIGPLTRFPVSDDFPVKIAGQVPEADLSAYPFLSARSLALWPSPIFKHALLVVHRALIHAGVEITPDIAHRTAVTFSSAVGGQDAVLAADRRMRTEGKLPPPYANPNSCINMVGGKVAMYAGATGPIAATITACATGATSLAVAALLMAAGKSDLAICGAVDFALVEPIVAGFATMNAAFRTFPGDPPEPPDRASRPFARDRKGFVISEGAGALILATADFAKAHGLIPRAVLAGWAMTSDAHHFVAPHLPTVQRCVAEAVADARISPADIHAVNAHGTSTKAGDRVEYDALTGVFGNRIPPVTANKSQIGHAMGAGSAVETVLALEGMTRGLLLPTLNWHPEPDMFLDAAPNQARSLYQEFVLKNAFGFGGCNTCLVLKRV